MILLSLIVPIYNMETYLERCLDSILRQGLDEEEYEVILVNDGSTDNSKYICERYVANHHNFRLIDQPNSGVAVARNTGIDAASGKFIGFVDSDDYLLDGGLNIAFRKYADRDDIDVIHFCSSYDFWDVRPIVDEVDYEGTTHNLLTMGGGSLPTFCWIYIYRKDFLDTHNIRFKTYCIGEDQLFISSVFIANARYLSTKADIYRYVVRESSTTTNRKPEHARRCAVDYLKSYSDIMQALKIYGIDQQSEVYDACMRSVNSKKTIGYSRILSSAYGLGDFHRIKELCRSTSFYPISLPGQNMKVRLANWLVNASLSNFAVYKLVSCLFNHIVTPYIMPRLRVSFKR